MKMKLPQEHVCVILIIILLTYIHTYILPINRFCFVCFNIFESLLCSARLHIFEHNTNVD